MSRVPFHAILLGFAGAWFSTLGACGRTAPGLEEFSNGSLGDDDDTTSGTGGSSARGGASSNGGSTRGGTANRGGSANGGASGDGAGGTSRGGSSFGGSGGDTAFGGTFGNGGTFGEGGTFAAGGSDPVGGSAGLGGSVAMGGSPSAGAGGSTPNGGMGAQGGNRPSGISCEDTVCDPALSVCCSRRSQPSYCADPAEGCPGVTLTCSGPGTCGSGEVCCFHGRSSSCTTDCQVSQGEPGNPPTIILCDSTADCGPDQTCVVAPRGIAYCGDNL